MDLIPFSSFSFSGETKKPYENTVIFKGQFTHAIFDAN